MDRHERLVRIARHADGDGVSEGVLLHRLPGLILRDGAVDGVAALRLRGDQARQLVDKADSVEVLETLPHARDGAAVADGDGEVVGHLPAELLGDLERDSLLALGEVGVDGGVAVVPAPLVDGLLGKLEGLLIVALHGNDVRTEGHQLRDLALGGAGGNEDEGLETRGGGVARERAGRIAGGRAGDDLRARLLRLGDRHSGGTVLEGRGGVLAVVLHPQLLEAEELRKTVLLIERAPAHAQRRVGRGLLHGQQLAVAPHRVRAALELFLGEIGLDVIVIVDDVEDTAALAVGEVGHGLVFLAALDAARAFHIFQHNNFS